MIDQVFYYLPRRPSLRNQPPNLPPGTQLKLLQMTFSYPRLHILYQHPLERHRQGLQPRLRPLPHEDIVVVAGRLARAKATDNPVLRPAFRNPAFVYVGYCGLVAAQEQRAAPHPLGPQ